jgi:hypothetical protein
MNERYCFPLRYDDAEMKAAIRAFMSRALFKESPTHTFVPLAILALSVGVLVYLGEGDIAAMLAALALFALGSFVSAGWRMHWRTMREKIEAAKGKYSFARLYDEGIVVEAGGPAPLLEWKAIQAIWPAGDAWLLILATNRFVALPVARAPKEALEFLRGKVGERA